MQTTEQIADHMAELLSSEQFSTSPRLADLLSFCVNAALTGNEDSLKETMIGINVFGRTPDYDPKIDPIVRVNVRRLRQKLDVFYGDRDEPQDIRILFPKGTYIPAFEIRDLPQTIAPQPEAVCPPLPEEVPSFPLAVDDQELVSKATSSALFSPILIALVVLLLIAMALVRYLYVVHLRDDASSSQVSQNKATGLLRPLTSLPGRKSDPQLSPDQHTLAFLWDANRSGILRAYLQQTSDLSPVLLTRSNSPEVRFVWSKDGGSIAVLRMVEPSRYELLLVDLSTKRERVIHTFEFNYTIERPALDMSPDGRWFVVGEQTAAQPIHLVLVNATDGSSKQITDPPDGSTGDVEAKFSPDGKSIALRRGQLGELYLTSVANQGIHTPVRLTFSNPGVRGISWSPDGKAIYFGSIDGGKEPSIWRYDCITREMKIVTPAGLAAVSPAVSSDGKNLIFTTSVPQMTFRIYDVHSHRPSEPFESVQGVQTNPSVSPDGKTVAYTSDAGGTMELWSVSETDRIPRKLTSFDGAGIPFFPSWSPDSKKIIFFYRERGLNYGYEIPAAGTDKPRLLRGGDDYTLFPQYSADGRSFFFLSNMGNRFRVWRASLPSQATSLQEVTINDTRYFRVAEDGQGLYYSSRKEQTTALFYHSFGNNTETKVWEWRYPPVGFTGWDIKKDQLYYIAFDPSSLVTHLYAADLKTKVVRDFGKVMVGEWSGASSLAAGFRPGTALISNVDTDDGNVMSLRLPEMPAANH